MAWTGLGKAYYFMNDFANSKISLEQANVYDPSNTEIWCYIALNCLKSNDPYQTSN